MTEAEWRACPVPYPMLEHLEDLERIGDDACSHRKLALFSIACLRRVWPLLTDLRSRKAVETVEAFWADDGSDEEADRSLADFYTAYQADELQDGPRDVYEAVEYLAYKGARAAMNVSQLVAEAVGGVASRGVGCESQDAQTDAWIKAEKAERAIQALLLRDILGPLPFRTVSIGPNLMGWNGGIVMALARSAYAAPEPTRLAVLADALEDGGCADAELLGHLRGPGPHVRGCWALDLALNRE